MAESSPFGTPSHNPIHPGAEAGESNSLPRWVWASVGVGAIAILFLLFLSLRQPDAKKDRDKKAETATEKNDPAQEARAILAQNRDIESCKKALILINQIPTQGAPAPIGGIQGLAPSDAEYIQSSSFPPGDAWYWAEQSLIKAIVSGNEMAPAAGKPLALNHLTDAWDWTMRSVRLSDLAVEAPEIKGIAPLYQVIRRGTGTAEERGLVFLELVGQLRHSSQGTGPFGCLVKTQRSTEDPLHLLVAFQVDAASPVFLGDPRTGRLLGKPGDVTPLKELLKNGVWISSFGSKGETTADFKLSLNGATFLVPFPLAALAERQKRAQTILFSSNDSPTLFRDSLPILDRIKGSLADAGLTDPKVIADPVFMDRLLNYLPKTEGGRDSGMVKHATELAMIPWNALPAELIPQVVQSVAESAFSKQQGRLPPGTDLENLGRLLQFDRPDKPERLGVSVPESVNVRLTLPVFGGVFLDWQTAVNKGRDLLVRGEFSRIVPDLIQEKDDLERKIGSISSKTRQDLVAWLKAPTSPLGKTAAGAGENNEEDVIRQAAPLLVYLADRVAQVRLADVLLALAQARHEQAATVDRKAKGNRQSQQGQDRLRQWKAAALAWGALAKEQQGTRLGAYARLWQGIALFNGAEPTLAKESWVAAGEGNLPEQITAKWLADHLAN